MADIVLAEDAPALYRETYYDNLITFEEDVARLSSVVLLISESAGALAELGAFATNDIIRPTLRVIIQDQRFKEESFVRLGPIDLIRNKERRWVGIYPWKTFNDGSIVSSSLREHYSQILLFINKHISNSNYSELYDPDNRMHMAIIIYWILHIYSALGIEQITRRTQILYPTLEETDVHNLLYCMKIARWVEAYSYGDEDYFFPLIDIDPIDYRFVEHPRFRDSSRWKLELATSAAEAEPVPRPVLKYIYERRLEPS